METGMIAKWYQLLAAILITSVVWSGKGVMRKANAQSDEAAAKTSEAGLPNLAMPTLGGKQFWTDHAWRQGWRIQQNAMTRHWRLLDEENVRRAWGSRAACQAALEKSVPRNAKTSDRVVVLLHGLMRSADSMNAMKVHLVQEMDCEVVAFQYASSRRPIAEHAEALRSFVATLPAGTKLSFVGHSMGNIVLRHAIGDWQRTGDRDTLERLHTVVMLGPPNQGAAIARQLAKTGVFGWVAGDGGLELGPKWDELESRLASPTCPFGIVAGRLENALAQNPLVGEEGDYVVGLEETKLVGASGFLVVPQLHSFLMDDRDVQKATTRFLSEGKF